MHCRQRIFTHAVDAVEREMRWNDTNLCVKEFAHGVQGSFQPAL
jgi:hypothetical protein